VATAYIRSLYRDAQRADGQPDESLNSLDVVFVAQSQAGGEVWVIKDKAEGYYFRTQSSLPSGNSSVEGLVVAASQETTLEKRRAILSIHQGKSSGAAKGRRISLTVFDGTNG
jgi:hypothetical protein